MRATTVTKMRQIIESEQDPLSVVVGFVLDENLDVSTRMNAASVCLPYLYPKLSASTVDSRQTIVNVDASEVMGRLAERLDRLARPVEVAPTIEAYPNVVIAADEDDDAEADGASPAT